MKTRDALPPDRRPKAFAPAPEPPIRDESKKAPSSGGAFCFERNDF
ncbi:hypothetical protein EM6_2082 [Asticcacaulis excentricus]|uniref:Uncharacterized protein n=1 Tax=Asticcacaulis excentricus TaxID=78587 RepID=A0A3G9G6L5_9CAUL|nr:hypothetical protein EM6_2082 [Asticcacaulis excentricus]